MWYLIGMLLCVAYFIVIPFVRHKKSWNNFLKTINVQQNLWHVIFGHFLISVVPLPVSYEDYCEAVWDWDDAISFWDWVVILVVIVLLWIVAIPLIIVFTSLLFIKREVEYYFKNKVNQNEPRGFKD